MFGGRSQPAPAARVIPAGRPIQADGATCIPVLVLSVVLRWLFGPSGKKRPRIGDERPPGIPSDDMGVHGDNGGE